MPQFMASKALQPFVYKAFDGVDQSVLKGISDLNINGEKEIKKPALVRFLFFDLRLLRRL